MIPREHACDGCGQVILPGKGEIVTSHTLGWFVVCDDVCKAKLVGYHVGPCNPKRTSL